MNTQYETTWCSVYGVELLTMTRLTMANICHGRPLMQRDATIMVQTIVGQYYAVLINHHCGSTLIYNALR